MSSYSLELQIWITNMNMNLGSREKVGKQITTKLIGGNPNQIRIWSGQQLSKKNKLCKIIWENFLIV